MSLRLPSAEQFKQWVEEIRNAGGRFSSDCADLVEFLAYSGLRVGESKWVEWRHCNFERDELLVTGDSVEGTKNSEMRWVPIIPAQEKHLQNMRERRSAEPETAKILKVNEAQKAMDRAAAKIGMDRIRHRDLGHLFATTCIESGVDNPHRLPLARSWLLVVLVIICCSFYKQGT